MKRLGRAAWIYAFAAALVLIGTSIISAQPAATVQPLTLEELLRPPTDTVTVRVRNFWATWCKPCIEELPVFDTIARRDPSVRVELISVDAPRDSLRVRAFWRRRGIRGVTAFHLQRVLRTAEIDAIAPEWSGTIPMTIVERGKHRRVHEGQLDIPTLRALIAQVRQP
ncbi:MAG: TlpA disulfide reductase family protein [Bacteroidota bacterium]|nr:TlpA family protein disulfide reductase [Candidatus Kapabacteria bacterium]MDW8075348.1 TlpA disulfide reductase family protein [Bacteroidota bacterium]